MYCMVIACAVVYSTSTSRYLLQVQVLVLYLRAVPKKYLNSLTSKKLKLFGFKMQSQS